MLATIDQLADAAADPAAPVTRATFEALRAEVNAKLIDALFATVSLAARVVGPARDADRAISSSASLSLMACSRTPAPSSTPLNIPDSCGSRA